MRDPAFYDPARGAAVALVPPFGATRRAATRGRPRRRLRPPPRRRHPSRSARRPVSRLLRVWEQREHQDHEGHVA